MLDHFGWKWWKKQTVIWHRPNREQRILHFALSDASPRQASRMPSPIRFTSWVQCPETGRIGELAGLSLEDFEERFRLAIEALAANCLRTRSFELASLSMPRRCHL